MSAEDPSQHLSHITTLWTLVYQAHGEPPQAGNLALQEMVQRYSGAVHRYLLGALRDPEAADELFQEFCVRFLRGSFRNADPDRGRFRDFLKTAVFHLIVDYQKRRQRQPKPLSAEIDEPVAAAPQSNSEAEQEFIKSWREELIGRTWLALEQVEQSTGQPHHTVLRLRTEHPVLSSEQLAQLLGQRLGKSFTVQALRQALHRARERFADLLLDEVAQSVGSSVSERIEAELIELGLLSYCRSSLERRRGL